MAQTKLSSNQVDLTSKQDTLVSGTNIKTINNISILGSGDLTIDSLPSQSGKAGKVLTTDGSTYSWEEVVKAPSLSETKDYLEFGSGSVEPTWDNLQIGDRLDNKATYVGTFASTDPGQSATNYAVFVLDAQYRSTGAWGPKNTDTGLPNYGGAAPDISTSTESATYNTNYIRTNYSDTYVAFKNAAEAATVTVNGVSYASKLPNNAEMKFIWGTNSSTTLAHRQYLDSLDPTLVDYPNNSLESWNIGNNSNNTIWCSNEYGSNIAWAFKNTGSITDDKTYTRGIVPVFEIPIPVPTARYKSVSRVKVDGQMYNIQDKSAFVISDLTSTSATITTLEYNTIYQYNTLSSLTISGLPTDYATSSDRYTLITIYFTSSSTGTTITLPAGLSWLSTAPAIKNNKAYVLYIRNGLVSAESSDKVSSTDITNIIKITQSDYDNLQTKDPNTLYLIEPAS